MLTLIYPPPAIITLEPITSFVESPIKSKTPASDVKVVYAISGSFGSWLVTKEISEVVLQSVLLKEIFTLGVKPIHDTSPVVPPTQLPQLSKKAIPFGVLLQSKGKLAVVKVSKGDQPEFGDGPGEQYALACQI